jgi:hypothetical protein
VTKGRKLANSCVVDIATGVYEAGTWLGQEFPHPQKGPDNTPAASSTIDITPVPRRLEGPGRGVGHLSLTSGTEWRIRLPRLSKELG